MKLGKKPAVADHRDLLFASYRSGPLLPPHPRVFGHERLVPADWGMLGNDEVGDCTCAGSAHETMMFTAEAGHEVAFATEGVLSDYSAITGYNPTDPDTDQGAEVRDVLNYRRKIGMVDATGKRHKILGYAALQPGDLTELFEAIWLFGAVAIGFEMPASAMDQTLAHKPWSVVRGSSIEGGHYVPGVASRGAGLLAPFADTFLADTLTARDLVVVTWGALQAATLAFYQKYNDETYAILSDEPLVAGKSLEGFDLDQLRADLAVL